MAKKTKKEKFITEDTVEKFNKHLGITESNDSNKSIEVLEMCVSDITFNFGNPRKPLNKKEKDKLRKSFEQHGDFGLIVIDEKNDVLAGNQRVAIFQEDEPNRNVLCKKLIGYSVAQKKAINIKDNVHSGEWDLDILATWTADLQVDLGFDQPMIDIDDRKNADMELIRYEKYDYVVMVCRNEIDYLNLTRKLGIDEKRVAITPKRKIKARAIWYDDIACQIVDKD